ASGRQLIPPFDDRRVIAANGTVAMEILEDCSQVDVMIVPIGGGGLIAGVVAAVKSLRPDVLIVGVEPVNSSAAYASLKCGELVSLGQGEHRATVADGLAISRIGSLTWCHIRSGVSRIIRVEEHEILSAIGRIATGSRLVAEPSGAVAVAAWLFHRD